MSLRMVGYEIVMYHYYIAQAMRLAQDVVGGRPALQRLLPP